MECMRESLIFLPLAKTTPDILKIRICLKKFSQGYGPRLQQMAFLIQKACLLTARTSKPVPIRINIVMRLSKKKHAVMRKNCRKKSKGIVRSTERSH